MAEPETGAHRILVVDDNRTNALLLERVLVGDGHLVDVANDGQEALERISSSRPDLILLDLDMPKVDGYEVCRRVKNDPATRLVPIVIVTAQNAFDAKLRAWELGADDFITKPFQCLEVVARARSLLRIKALVEERDSAEAVVFAFARVVEAKSPYTHGHSERVATYALMLAAKIGVPENEWETLPQGLAAARHWQGERAGRHPGQAGDADAGRVRHHEAAHGAGARIAEPLRSVRDAVPLIRWHHERLDGRGYPDGLYRRRHSAAGARAVGGRRLRFAGQRPSLSRPPFRICNAWRSCGGTRPAAGSIPSWSSRSAPPSRKARWRRSAGRPGWAKRSSIQPRRRRPASC